MKNGMRIWLSIFVLILSVRSLATAAEKSEREKKTLEIAHHLEKAGYNREKAALQTGERNFRRESEGYVKVTSHSFRRYVPFSSNILVDEDGDKDSRLPEGARFTGGASLLPGAGLFYKPEVTFYALRYRVGNSIPIVCLCQSTLLRFVREEPTLNEDGRAGGAFQDLETRMPNTSVCGPGFRDQS